MLLEQMGPHGAGKTRTFQLVRPFPSVSVLDNVCDRQRAPMIMVEHLVKALDAYLATDHTEPMESIALV